MAHPPQVQARRRLALNARRAREHRGWTQEQSAEAVGCSVQQIRRIERAAVNTSIDLVALLASAYRLDVAELLAPAGPWSKQRVGRPAKRAMPRAAGPA